MQELPKLIKGFVNISDRDLKEHMIWMADVNGAEIIIENQNRFFIIPKKAEMDTYTINPFTRYGFQVTNIRIIEGNKLEVTFSR